MRQGKKAAGVRLIWPSTTESNAKGRDTVQNFTQYCTIFSGMDTICNIWSSHFSTRGWHYEKSLTDQVQCATSRYRVWFCGKWLHDASFGCSLSEGEPALLMQHACNIACNNFRDGYTVQLACCVQYCVQTLVRAKHDHKRTCHPLKLYMY